MCNRRFGIALIVLGALIFPVNSTFGFEGSFKLPCMVSYDNKVPFVVSCAVTIHIKEGHVVEMVKTPNGKFFIIENGAVDSSKWYLNHKAAIITASEPKPCYSNAEVKVCL